MDFISCADKDGFCKSSHNLYSGLSQLYTYLSALVTKRLVMHLVFIISAVKVSKQTLCLSRDVWEMSTACS